MHISACKPPHKPGIYCSEKQFSLLGTFAGTGNIVKNPFYFRSTEISVDYKTGLFAYLFLHTILYHFVAIIGRSPVLPYYGVIDRLLCVTIPDNGCFTLVCNTYCLYIFAVDVDRRDSLCNHRSLRSPDLMRVMLHPSRMRKDLRKFLLSHSTY